MSALMFGLLAETHIHPGTGQEDETVDLPVARERTTGYPMIAGSSVKGGLKAFAAARDKASKDATTGMTKAVLDLFGIQESAGQLMVGDARLLLLPVRSLTGSYRWLTCPHLIERLARDCRRAGLEEVPGLDATALNGAAADGAPPILAMGRDRLFLEERSFTIVGGVDPTLTAFIRRFIGTPEAAARLADQIAIVSNDDFTWFARNALSIQARNALDPDKKTSKNLWYEETLPPDTLFHVMLSPRTERGSQENVDWLRCELHGNWLQLGANETVGQGWFQATHVSAGGQGE